MNVVVDASAMFDFLLGRPQAQHLSDREDGRVVRLHAPELIEPEVLQTLRRYVRRGAVTAARAARLLDDLVALPMVRHGHAPLRRRVWSLRDHLSAYDATYLALAEAIHGGVLVTADAGLATHARAVLGVERVRLVA